MTFTLADVICEQPLNTLSLIDADADAKDEVKSPEGPLASYISNDQPPKQLTLTIQT